MMKKLDILTGLAAFFMVCGFHFGHENNLMSQIPALCMDGADQSEERYTSVLDNQVKVGPQFVLLQADDYPFFRKCRAIKIPPVVCVPKGQYLIDLSDDPDHGEYYRLQNLTINNAECKES